MSSRIADHRLLLVVSVVALLTAVILSGCSAGQTPERPLNTSLGTSSAVTSGAPVAGAISLDAASYSAEWRRAWEDNIVWTRLAVIAIASDSPASAEIQTRLLSNASDMQALMAPYYGDKQATYFKDLMTGHIQTTLDLAKAVKASNAASATAAEKSWYANAALMSAFLSKANPNIDQTAAVTMLNRHLVLTKGEIVDHMGKNWSADIGDYDALQSQTLEMSDIISNSIMRQFPTKF